MEPFEVTVDHELFRISERLLPGGSFSYDFAWLNGPAEGTYGFTIGRSAVGAGGHGPETIARMTEDELIDEVRGFVESAYEAGGIVDGDFPDHTPARVRRQREQ